MRKILITGATGLVGSALTKELIYQGYTINILSRSKRSNELNISYYKWNIESNYLEKDALKNVDTIIHLAGENIGKKRWSINQKKVI